MPSLIEETFDTKLGLLGSYQADGQISNTDSSAVDRFYVHSLTNNRFSLGEAIEKVRRRIIQDNGGLWHHDNTDLPVRLIRAHRFGPNKAMGTVIYSTRSRNSGFIPPRSANVIAEMRDAWEAVRVFRTLGHDNEPGREDFDDAGLPNGDFYKFREDDHEGVNAKEPRSYVLQVPVLKLYLPTVLTFNPTKYIFPLKGYINSDEVLFVGDRFSAGTIRFDGMSVVWKEGAPPQQGLFGFNRDHYLVHYSFTIRRGGHRVQEPKWTPGATPELSFWDTRLVYPYPSAPFANTFPVHG